MTEEIKEEKPLTILQKLAKARKIIRDTPLQKDGENTFSKYDYFTPQFVEEIVAKACEETNTICITNLTNGTFGYKQTLQFIDLETESKLEFELATDRPEIKATNATQQMGGMDTYSERYIKMKVFQIKDNNLDPDSQDNRKSEKVIQTQDMSKPRYEKKVAVPVVNQDEVDPLA